MSDGPRIVHASCVAINGRALLIMGASGSGKSGFALQMMALGADLISDDRVRVWCDQDCLRAAAPETLKGMIEARGLGILYADVSAEARICAVLSMDQIEASRLPARHFTNLLGHEVPLFYQIKATYAAAAFVQFLKGGMLDPDDPV